ncbi:MAG: hypothetical protein AB1486_15640 [Planctomycetota bacterium]
MTDPALIGLTLYLQVLVLDPGAPQGVAATRAAAMLFGDLPPG